MISYGLGVTGNMALAESQRRIQKRDDDLEAQSARSGTSAFSKSSKATNRPQAMKRVSSASLSGSGGTGGGISRSSSKEGLVRPRRLVKQNPSDASPDRKKPKTGAAF